MNERLSNSEDFARRLNVGVYSTWRVVTVFGSSKNSTSESDFGIEAVLKKSVGSEELSESIVVLEPNDVVNELWTFVTILRKYSKTE